MWGGIEGANNITKVEIHVNPNSFKRNPISSQIPGLKVILGIIVYKVLLCMPFINYFTGIMNYQIFIQCQCQF